MAKKLYGRVRVEPASYGYNLFLSVGNGEERYALREQDFYALKEDVENITLEKIKTMSTTESLWPEELFSLPLTLKEKEDKAPYTVFKQAGEELLRKTDKLINYRLHKTKLDYGANNSITGDVAVCLQLFLVLGDSSVEFKFLEASYAMASSGYPLMITPFKRGCSEEIASHEKLIGYLKELFAKEETLHLIANLKTNAKFLADSE